MSRLDSLSRVLVGLGVALLCAVGLTASPAAAQWETTDWAVRCILVEPNLQAPCERRNGMAEQTQRELVDASVWLQDLGFRTPDLEIEDGRYVARFNDFAQSTVGLAHYNPSDRRIILGTGLFTWHDPSDESFIDGVVEDGKIDYRESYVFSSVHELFHAVTFQYVDIRPTLDSHKWIWEGIAEAVRYAWASGYGTTALPYRFLDYPLDAPYSEPSPSDPSGAKEAYDTALFWYHVGGDVGSPERIGYLHGLLEELERDVDASNNGVEAVYRALAPHGGMADLYPQFVARHARDATHFRTEKDLRIRRGQEISDAEAIYDPLDPLATNAYRVIASVPPGEQAALSVQFQTDHPDLHLIVDGTRYDEKPFRPDVDNDRNIFRRTLVGDGPPDTVRVRVANVSMKAGDRQPRMYVLDVGLEPVDHAFTYQTSGTASLRRSGEVQAFNGTPMTGGCMLSIRLTTDPYAPGVELAAFLPDGLQPGTYPIGPKYAGALPNGSKVTTPSDPTELPRATPGTFLVSVGTGTEADEDGWADVYLSQTGTVTVNRTGERAVSMTFDAQLVEDDHETLNCDPKAAQFGGPPCSIPPRRRLGVTGSLVHSLRTDSQYLGSFDWYGCNDD